MLSNATHHAKTLGAFALAGALSILAALPAPAADEPTAPAISAAEEAASAIAAPEEIAAPAAEEAASTAPASAPAPVPDAGKGKTVYAITINTDAKGMIDRDHHYVIHRKLSEAEAAGADAFAIELNTNGGRLDAALMINDRLLQATIPTYVYVNTRAISAGAMIAISADHIGMHSGSTIGAALPVVPTASAEEGDYGIKAADAKVISALAAQMKAAAEAKNHPVKVAAAMVDPGQPLEGYGEKGDLLTLTTDQALATGLADFKADNFADFLAKAGLGGAEVVHPKLSSIEKAAAQLSRPFMASILMGLAIIMLILEAKSPGIGFPLAGALVCFGLAQFGSMMADLSGVLEPILLLVGFGLIALEIFVIPGFGVAGLAGAACVLAGVVFSMNEMPSTANGIMHYWIGPTVYSILGSLVGAMVGLPIVLKLLPHVPYFNALVMEPSDDFVASAPAPDRLAALKAGMLGVAAVDCRPSGSATFGESQRFDVVSEGRFIEKGSFIVIKEIAGNRVVVAPKPLDSV